MAAYFDQPELRRLRRSSKLGKSRITTKACTQLLLLLSILLNLPSYAAEKSSISENVVVTDEVADNSIIDNEQSNQPTTVSAPAINAPAINEPNNSLNSTIAITPAIPNTSDSVPPTPPTPLKRRTASCSISTRFSISTKSSSKHCLNILRSVQLPL